MLPLGIIGWRKAKKFTKIYSSSCSGNPLFAAAFVVVVLLKRKPLKLLVANVGVL